jgi:hypothetical protein
LHLRTTVTQLHIARASKRLSEGMVRDNLLQHSPDYPTTASLFDCIKIGQPRMGLEYVGENHDTEAS